jgi:hypothetical protein
MLGENPAERSDTYGYLKIQWFIIFPMKTAIWGVHPGFSDTPGAKWDDSMPSSKSWFTTEFHQQGQSCHKTASNIRSGYIKPNIHSMYQYPQK